MASSPAFAASQGAAPMAAAAAPSNQTFDHQLVDLLWFYGCLHDAQDFHSVLQHPHQLRSANTASIHSPHQSLRKHGESCNSAGVDIIQPSHPLRKHQASLNAADRGVDIGYLLPGGALGCDTTGDAATVGAKVDIGYLLPGGGLGHGTKGDVAKVGAVVDNAPVPCLQQCLSSTPPASAKWLRQVFDTFDENKDGMLSTDELRRSLEKLGIEASEESIDSLLSYSPSKDQKGLVSQDDFLTLYQGASCTQCALHYNNNHYNVEHIDCKTMNEDGADEELLWDAFNIFDKDGDGFISPIELQSVLCSLGFGVAQELDECSEMIKRYDQDGDGQVDFEEFKAMLNSAIKHT